ncbi:MAG TPA: carbohydrate binding domain-containing protein, partial [Polyangiaceae bacterium]|nr:carbohydrate binding domain-containing protein [Polyangiaceae bacterium]
MRRDSSIGSEQPRRAWRPVGRRARVALLLVSAAGLAGALASCKKSSAGAANAPLVATSPPPEGKHSLLRNASFGDGSSLPWLTSFSAPATGSTDVKGEALCLTLDDKGKNAWDAQLVQRPLVIQQGHTYAVDFRAWATAATM